MSIKTFEEYLKEEADKNALPREQLPAGVSVEGSQPETALHTAEAAGAANPKDGEGKPLDGVKKKAETTGNAELPDAP